MLNDSTITTLATNVVDTTDLGGGRIQWNIERTFTMPDTVITETSFAYIVAGDSIYIHEPRATQDYLAFLIPLWVGKSWPTGDGGTRTVLELGSRQVPAASQTALGLPSPTVRWNETTGLPLISG